MLVETKGGVSERSAAGPPRVRLDPVLSGSVLENPELSMTFCENSLAKESQKAWGNLSLHQPPQARASGSLSGQSAITN